MNYFPVFFDLSGQKVLIVGGGEVALRKISLLERSGASLSVVAPEVAPGILERAAAGKLSSTSANSCRATSTVRGWSSSRPRAAP